MFEKVLIIAEAGVNHNGSLERAKKMVDVAKEMGADAIKFQTYQTELLVCKATPKANYQIQNTGEESSQFSMLKSLELSYEDFSDLHHYCSQQNLLFLSTPFDHESVDFLESLNLPLYKISSGELTNVPLLTHIALKKRPVILSTGMSTLDEVRTALEAFYSNGVHQDQITLLHTTSLYPTPVGKVNLRAMQTLAKTFNVKVGFSDHTLGSLTAIAAVAMGACVIEKHITLDRKLPGPDHAASATPEEFAEMVKGIRYIENALGKSEKSPVQEEIAMRPLVRKSIVAQCDIAKGDLLSLKNLGFKRVGAGISVASVASVLGKNAPRAFKKDDIIILE